MTFNRDKRNDRIITEKLIRSDMEVVFTEPSWLDHKGKGAILDYELLKGATKEQLASRSGRKLSAVSAHIYHLKKEHGLDLSNSYGVHKIISRSKLDFNEEEKIKFDNVERIKSSSINDYKQVSTLKIGQFVKDHIQKIFHYCILEEPDELSRLMDKDYSKRVFNINFPFCKELSQLTEDELVRYWKIDYKVQNKILRVCSQWVIDSKELFLAYLMSKNIINEQEYYGYKNIVQKRRAIQKPASHKNINIKKTSEIVRKPNIIEKKEQITKFDETDSDLYFDEKLRAEAAEMARYYEVFYSLERSIRSLIVEVMENKYGKLWWETKVDYRVRENVKRNLEYELDTPHTKRSEHKIDYATFGDLRKIINTNWADFQSKFNRNMSSVNEILIDLNRIRVPIAHSTPLARREVQRLELRIGDWFDHLKD